MVWILVSTRHDSPDLHRGFQSFVGLRPRRYQLPRSARPAPGRAPRRRGSAGAAHEVVGRIEGDPAGAGQVGVQPGVRRAGAGDGARRAGARRCRAPRRRGSPRRSASPRRAGARPPSSAARSRGSCRCPAARVSSGVCVPSSSRACVVQALADVRVHARQHLARAVGLVGVQELVGPADQRAFGVVVVRAQVVLEVEPLLHRVGEGQELGGTAPAPARTSAPARARW